MRAQLQEFSKIIQGGRHRKSGKDFVDAGFPAYGAGGMNGYLSEYEFEKPGIVLSSIGARCGKCFLPSAGRWSSLANTQLIFPDEDKADIRFIWYQLNDESSWIRRGTGQPYIRPADVKKREVYFPALEEQRRIANVLDKADGIRRKCDSVLEKSDELLKSVFLEMFGDPSTNPMRWPVATLEDVGEVQGGLQVTKTRDAFELQLPYLRVANVYRDRLALGEIKQIGLTPAEFERTKLETGDILIVEGHGNPEEIGRAAVWDGSIDPCVHQNHLIRFRADRSMVCPLYVSRVLNSAGGRLQLIAAGRTTSGLNTISTRKVKEVWLPVPPLSVQEKFEAFARRRNLASCLFDADVTASNELFASLSRRAFRGGL